MNKFKFWVKKLNPIPKLIIGFHTYGCMDTERDFKWIGYVTKEWLSDPTTKFPTDLYEVQPILFGATENRDYKEKSIPKVTAYQIQHLWLNLYIFYDA